MSRRTIVALAAALAASSPAIALACGGFYASEVEVAPNQKIVVAHRDGVETYVFRPHFCGAAKDFGVILPIPASLSASPSLADNALFDQLDLLSTPTVEEVCSGGGIACGGAAAPGGVWLFPDAGSSVDVIEQGRVGQFDYVLLKAARATDFTDWLDQNGFPRGQTSADVWGSYVSKGWYFVAFKVTAAASAPPQGKKLCGDLGPIQLSFPVAQPVVPARIAAANALAGAPPVWRIFVVAAHQQAISDASAFGASLYFSAALSAAGLAQSPAVAAFARDGERLTALDVAFPSAGPSDDLVLAEQAVAADFRSRVTVPKDCGGCSAGGSVSVDAAALAIGLALALASRRAARRAGTPGG